MNFEKIDFFYLKSKQTLRCHKVINDFLFVDSSSILLTVGTSNDSFSLSFWDTLLPPSKSLIKSNLTSLTLMV